MPKAIADLGKQFINDPVRVEMTPQATTAERVEQFVHLRQPGGKAGAADAKLRAGLADGKSIDRALVFTRTKHGADRVVRHLASARRQGRRDPRQQEPGPAHRRAGAFRQGTRQCSSPPTSPRAASTSTGAGSGACR
jgi:ATP-dependent RNA helicase RhlE